MVLDKLCISGDCIGKRQQNSQIPDRSIDPAYTPNAYYEISRECLHDHIDQLCEGEDPDSIAMELCVMAKGIIFSWANERGDFDIDKTAEHMFRAYLKSVIRID